MTNNYAAHQPLAFHCLDHVLGFPLSANHGTLTDKQAHCYGAKEACSGVKTRAFQLDLRSKTTKERERERKRQKPIC